MVRYTVGGTTVSKSARLKSDCSYSTSASLRKPGSVKVKATFAGNSVYSSRSSATKTVRAG